MKKALIFSLLAFALLLSACRPADQGLSQENLGAPPAGATPFTGEPTSSTPALSTEALATQHTQGEQLQNNRIPPPSVGGGSNTRLTPTASDAANPTPAPTSASLPETGTQATPSDSAQASDPTDAVISAMLALSDLASFRVDQQIESPQGSFTQQIEIVTPNRFRLINPEMEMILIDDSAYIKAGDAWMSAPGDSESVFSFFTFLKNEEEVEIFRQNMSNVQHIGAEDLNGEAVQLYEYDLTEAGGDATAHVRLWVADSDGLPRRAEITTSGADGSSTVTNDYKDFNADIQIDPPQ